MTHSRHCTSEGVLDIDLHVFPGLSEVSFLVALIAAVGGFWVRFRRVLVRIEAAKPDPKFSIHPIPKRVWDFFWEVMCQAKVIRERPLPGLAHAFVFWGFCVFALITLNHFAQALGFPILDNMFGDAYKTFARWFGVAVAISILGLFVRRFFVRPKWLGELSKESGIIALLIFALMVTFILVALYPQHEKALWWAHTAALLAFLPLIPHTKHLHLALSPFTVFLRAAGFSAIPPLAGDEDFGLDTGKDVTRIDALQAYTCVECGRCTEHCPAYNTRQGSQPQGNRAGRARLSERIRAGGEEPLLGKHISEEAAFQCTTCGACEYQCPVGIQHLPMIVGLRRGAVNTGKWEDDYGAKLFLNLERNGNASGFASSERQKFIEKKQLPVFRWHRRNTACGWAVWALTIPRAARSSRRWPACCEHPASLSASCARRDAPAIRRGAWATIWYSSNSRNRARKRLTTQKLPKLCRSARIACAPFRPTGASSARRLPSSITANSWRVTSTNCPESNRTKSCSMTRVTWGGIEACYEEPRAVSEAAKWSILNDRRERSFCCGAGGGLAFLGEEKGERVSHNRAKELVATGAQE